MHEVRMNKGGGGASGTVVLSSGECDKNNVQDENSSFTPDSVAKAISAIYDEVRFKTLSPFERPTFEGVGK